MSTGCIYQFHQIFTSSNALGYMFLDNTFIIICLKIIINTLEIDLTYYCTLNSLLCVCVQKICRLLSTDKIL